MLKRERETPKRERETREISENREKTGHFRDFRLFRVFRVLSFVCCIFIPTLAQKPPASPNPTPALSASPSPSPSRLEIAANPSQITVAAVHNAVATRRLLFTAAGAVNEIKIIPLDLTRSDDQAVLPATAIKPQVSSAQVNPNDPLVVPITFDLNGVISGEYKGELRVQFQNGNINVPVTVKIKDPWPPPLLALALGIVLSMVVTQYRERGRPRDEILARLGKVRGLMEADTDLNQNFKRRVEALFIDVNALLNTEKWDDAGKSMGLAEDVMNRWRKGRADWLLQFKFSDELMERLKQYGEPPNMPPYLLAVRRSVEDAGREAPDLTGPDKLREKLDKLAKQLNDYSQSESRIQTLVNLTADLETNRDEWRNKAQKLQQKLNNISPEKTDALTNLNNEIENGITELKKLLQQQTPRRAMAKAGLGVGDEIIQLNLMSPAPSARSLEAEIVEDAGKRLLLFKRASYALAVILFAGAGFSELYIAKPTFGANRWSDYFTLLAWGFGAEATRSAVTGLMKNWGIK